MYVLSQINLFLACMRREILRKKKKLTSSTTSIATEDPTEPSSNVPPNQVEGCISVCKKTAGYVGRPVRHQNLEIFSGHLCAAGWEGFLQGDFFLESICRLKNLGNDLSSDSTTLHTRSTSAFSVNKMCKKRWFCVGFSDRSSSATS